MLRGEAEKLLPFEAPAGSKATQADIDAVRDALYASKIIAYAQGFEQMTAASKDYGWDLKLGDVATIWRGGCIIRARFLNRIRDAYKASDDIPNLVLEEYFRDAVLKAEPAWRKVVMLAVQHGVAIPAFSSSLSYYDGLRRSRGPANLLQGLRDYFGAHTYRRLDGEGHFHTRWSQDGTEIRTDQPTEGGTPRSCPGGRPVAPGGRPRPPLRAPPSRLRRRGDSRRCGGRGTPGPSGEDHKVAGQGQREADEARPMPPVTLEGRGQPQGDDREQDGRVGGLGRADPGDERQVGGEADDGAHRREIEQRAEVVAVGLV